MWQVLKITEEDGKRVKTHNREHQNSLKVFQTYANNPKKTPENCETREFTKKYAPYLAWIVTHIKESLGP